MFKKIFIIIIIIFLILHIYTLRKTNSNIEILQVDTPSKEKFNEIISYKLPVVITGCMDNWDEFIYWSPEYILKKYPNFDIKISKGVLEQENTNVNKLKIKDYIEWIKKAEEKNKSEYLYCNEDLNFIDKIG